MNEVAVTVKLSFIQPVVADKPYDQIHEALQVVSDILKHTFGESVDLTFYEAHPSGVTEI